MERAKGDPRRVHERANLQTAADGQYLRLPWMVAYTGVRVLTAIREIIN